MLLRNARLTGARVDVAVAGGLITAVGDLEYRRGEVIDLEGRSIVAGLWDQHVHFTQWALSRQRLDLGGARSAGEAAELVRAAPRPAGALPLVGKGFRDGLWPDVPSRALLDKAAPDIPVVLVAADLHSCWLNTLALERFGHAGHATGLLREEECFAVVHSLDDVPAPVLDGWVREAAKAAAARGVVGIVDLEMRWNLETWRARRAAGFDELRVALGVYPQHLDRAIAEGLRTGDDIDELLTVGPLKVITDGSLNTRTAYCVDPYPGLAEHAHGLLTVPRDELRVLLARGAAAGLVPAVHAIGDEANRLALDVFEELGCGGRIEHAQLLRDADLGRFARLRVAASVQPEHALDDRDVAEHYWAGRTGRAFPLRSLLDAGATLLLGSDAPVAPLDPWIAIGAAVARTRDDREPWHAEQAISVGEALAASARTSVVVGQPADLVVLDADPYTAPATALRSMPVAATLLGGRFTHRAL